MRAIQPLQRGAIIFCILSALLSSVLLLKQEQTCPNGQYFERLQDRCTNCPTGSYCPTNSVVAYPCPAGTFNGQERQTSSNSCQACSAGFISASGSDACTQCGDGYYANAAATACLPCTLGYTCSDGIRTECLDGTYNTDVFGQCLRCPAGYQCPSKSSPPEICEEGTYSLGGQMSCTTCPSNSACPLKQSSSNCPPGYYPSAAGCVLCPLGRFCPDGLTVNNCPSNQFASKLGSTSCVQRSRGQYFLGSDFSATVCPLGSYDSGSGCETCPAGSACPDTTTIVSCQAGTFSLGGQTQCTTCPLGYSCNTPNAAPSPCLAGFYGNPTGGDCLPCQTGFVCPHQAMTEMLRCTRGTYPKSTSESCQLCPAGHRCSVTSEIPIACALGTYALEGQGECTPCPAGHYCQDTKQVSPCQPGTFSVGNATSCTTCPLGSVCPYPAQQPISCPAGTMVYNNDPFRCHICPAGFFCPTPGVILACDPGQISSPGSLSCTPCPEGHACPTAIEQDKIECLPGQYSPEGSTACLTCPAGSSCSSTYALPCEAGSYSPGSLETCSRCPAGFYCPEGSTAPVPCPVNTYSDASSGRCQPCPAGYICAPQTSLATSRDIPCPVGGYCAQGAGYLPCPSGTYNNITLGTSLSSCRPCPPGYFCPEETWDLQTERQLCPAGHYCPQGTKDGFANPCPAGTFRGLKGAANFTECITCRAGAWCPSGTTNPDKSPCPAGHFCLSGAIRPTPCPAGTKTGPVTGLTSAAGCVACDPGHYCVAGSVDPAPCPTGSWTPFTNATSLQSCYICPAGSFCPLGSGSLSPCREGHYCPRLTDEPLPCEPGSFTILTNATSQADCSPCPAGFMCKAGTSGQSSPPLPCPKGYYCPQGTQDSDGSLITDRTPKLCPSGTYSPLYGLRSADECLACPAGRFCLGGDTQVSGNCADGHYCPLRTRFANEHPCPAGTFYHSSNGSEILNPQYAAIKAANTAVAFEAGQAQAHAISMHECHACPPGFFCPEGSSFPIPCDQGLYRAASNGTSAQDCSLCPAGYSCPSFSTIVPLPCQPGSYSESGQLFCSPCPAGKYCAEPAMSRPKDCDAGLHCPAETNVEPSVRTHACPAGHYCIRAATRPEPCPVGRYNPSTRGTSESSCLPCPIGFYCDGGGVNPSGPCPKGSYCPAGSSRFSAVLCPAGTYKPSTGGGTSEACTDCPSGFFCANVGTSSPTICPSGRYCPPKSSQPTACSIGFYSLKTGLKSESQCTPCTAGFFCSTNGLATPTGSCSEGFYCPPGSSSSTQNECPEGHYCPSGSQSPFQCPSGTYQPAKGKGSLSECIQCPPGKFCKGTALTLPSGDCSAGYYCDGGSSSPTQHKAQPGYYAPAASSDQTECAAGTFTSSPAQQSCSECPAGFVCPTRTADPQPCPSGSYCPAGSGFVRNCPAGTYNPSLQAHHVDSCLDCPPGKYCTGGGSTPTGDCDAGYICLGQAPSSRPSGTTTNILDCPVGHFCPLGSTNPTPCPIGSYSSLQTRTSIADCVPCDAGKYCPRTGLDAPFGECNPGHYCNRGQSSASPDTGVCPLGHYCPSGTPSPFPCPPGKFANQTGMDQCNSCTAGYYCPERSQVPLICSAGNYCPPESSFPTQCPLGTFSNRQGLSNSTQCSLCTPGKYCDQAGLTAATKTCNAGFLCQKGAVSPNGSTASDISPNPCPSGHYCLSGTTTPTPCQSGTFASATGGIDASHCLPCSAGSYCDKTGLSAPSGNCTRGYYCLEGSNSPIPKDTRFGSICPPGHYCPPGTQSATQYPCPSGTYSNSHGLGAIGECLACPPGWYCDVASTSPSGKCQAGFYCRHSSSSPRPALGASFGPCTDGMFCPEGTGVPSECPGGRFCNTVSILGECTAGFFCITGAASSRPSLYPQTGVALRGPCPRGTFCPVGTVHPQLCPPGTIGTKLSATKQSDCEKCPAGFYCSAYGLSSAEGPCDEGYFCPQGTKESSPPNSICPAHHMCPTGSALPTPCPQGTHQANVAQAHCDSCPAGFKCPGATEPVPCPFSYYCPEGTTTPTPCPPGTYTHENETVGASSATDCLPCPTGKYCAAEGANGAIPRLCDAGYYCMLGASSPRPQVNATTLPARALQLNPRDPPSRRSFFQKFSSLFGRFFDDGDSQPVESYHPAFEISYAPSVGADDDFYTSTGPQVSEVSSRSSSLVLQSITGFPCPVGYYCPRGTTVIIRCPSGNTTTAVGNQSKDDCKSCPPGMYCAQGEQVLNGLQGRKCEAGFVCTGGAETPRPSPDAGYICPAGHFCPEGALSPTPCQPGTYSPQKGLSECISCPAGWYCPISKTINPTECPIGAYCQEGSSTYQKCPTGTFGVSKQARKSDDCAMCTAGSYCAQPTLDVLLDKPTDFCNEGYLCLTGATSPNPSVYDLHGNGPCPQGHYCPRGTTAPLACPEGTFNNKTLSSSASDCIPCTAGHYCDVRGGNSTVGLCDPGFYCSEGSSSSREKSCPSGSFCPLGSARPLECAAGTIQPEIEMPTCFGCPAGKYQPAKGMVDCMSCPTGSYCPEGSANPTPCPNGSYSQSWGLDDISQCIACPAGYFCISGVFNQTNRCDAGYYCPPGSDSPTTSDCPSGFYCPSGSATPIPCPSGFTSKLNSKLASDCETCPAGLSCEGGMTIVCPAGYYCNAQGIKTPCPAGTYSNALGQDSRDTCKDCPEGYFCPEGSATNMARVCPAGFYCPLRSSSPSPCPVGTYSVVMGASSNQTCSPCIAGQFCPLNSTTPQRCPAGFVCESGLKDAQPCPDGSYCPESSSSARSCRPGYYCPKVQVQPLPALLDNGQYICPNISLTKELCPHPNMCCFVAAIQEVPCPEDSYCPPLSSSPIMCPEGYMVAHIAPSVRDSLESSCEICPLGFAGVDPQRKKCTPCAGGFLCQPGARSITPFYPVFGGSPCPPGHYCQENPVAHEYDNSNSLATNISLATLAIPCPRGTFNPSSGANSSEACTPCEAGSYSNRPGQSGCNPCGHTSFSPRGASLCQCYGLNRVFQPSDSSCRCMPGFQAYDSTLNVLDGDGDSDCIPIEYQNCGLLKTRTASGDCVDSGDDYCSSVCPRGTGRFLVETGICECDDQRDVDQICDAVCRERQTVITFRADDARSLRINGYNQTTTTINLLESSTIFGSLTCPADSCVIPTVTMGENGFLGLMDPTANALESLFTPGRRRSTQSDQISTPSKGISNPLLCIKEGESVLFEVRPENKQYPKYDHRSLLNSNPAFDYSPFLELEEQILHLETSIQVFAASFDKSGTYVFVSSINDAHQTIVRVVSPSESCGESNIMPKTQSSAASLSLTKKAPTSTAIDWGIFSAIIAGVAAGSFGVAYAFHHYATKVRLPRDPVYTPPGSNQEADPDLEWVSLSSELENSLPLEVQADTPLLTVRGFYDILENQNLLLRQKMNESLMDSRVQYENMTKRMAEVQSILQSKVEELLNMGVSNFIANMQGADTDNLDEEIARRKEIAQKAILFLGPQNELYHTDKEQYSQHTSYCDELDGETLGLLKEIQECIAADLLTHAISKSTEDKRNRLRQIVGEYNSIYKDEIRRRAAWLDDDGNMGGYLVDPIRNEVLTIDHLCDEQGNLREIPDLVEKDKTTGVFVPALGTKLMMSHNSQVVDMPRGMCLHPLSGRVIPIQGALGIEASEGKVVFTMGYKGTLSPGVRVYPYLYFAVEENTQKLCETPWRMYATKHRIQSSYLDPFTGLRVPTLAVAIDPFSKERVPIGASYHHPVYKIFRPVHYDEVAMNKSTKDIFSISGVTIDISTGRVEPLGGAIPYDPQRYMCRGERYNEGLSNYEITLSGCYTESLGNVTPNPYYGDELTLADSIELKRLKDFLRELHRVALSVETCMDGINEGDDEQAGAHRRGFSERVLDMLQGMLWDAKRARAHRKSLTEQRVQYSDSVLQTYQEVVKTGGALGYMKTRSGDNIPILLGETIREQRTGLHCPILGVHKDSRTGKLIPLAGSMSDPVTGETVPIVIGGRMRNPANGSVCLITGAVYDELRGKVMPISEAMKSNRPRVKILQDEALHRFHCSGIAQNLLQAIKHNLQDLYRKLYSKSQFDPSTIDDIIFLIERNRTLSQQIPTTWNSSSDYSSHMSDGAQGSPWGAMDQAWSKRILRENEIVGYLSAPLEQMNQMCGQLEDMKIRSTQSSQQVASEAELQGLQSELARMFEPLKQEMENAIEFVESDLGALDQDVSAIKQAFKDMGDSVGKSKDDQSDTISWDMPKELRTVLEKIKHVVDGRLERLENAYKAVERPRQKVIRKIAQPISRQDGTAATLSTTKLKGDSRVDGEEKAIGKRGVMFESPPSTERKMESSRGSKGTDGKGQDHQDGEASAEQIAAEARARTRRMSQAAQRRQSVAAGPSVVADVKEIQITKKDEDKAGEDTAPVDLAQDGHGQTAVDQQAVQEEAKMQQAFIKKMYEKRLEKAQKEMKEAIDAKMRSIEEDFEKCRDLMEAEEKQFESMAQQVTNSKADEVARRRAKIQERKAEARGKIGSRLFEAAFRSQVKDGPDSVVRLFSQSGIFSNQKKGGVLAPLQYFKVDDQQISSKIDAARKNVLARLNKELEAEAEQEMEAAHRRLRKKKEQAKKALEKAGETTKKVVETLQATKASSMAPGVDGSVDQGESVDSDLSLRKVEKELEAEFELRKKMIHERMQEKKRRQEAELLTKAVVDDDGAPVSTEEELRALHVKQMQEARDEAAKNEIAEIEMFEMQQAELRNRLVAEEREKIIQELRQASQRKDLLDRESERIRMLIQQLEEENSRQSGLTFAAGDLTSKRTKTKKTPKAPKHRPKPEKPAKKDKAKSPISRKTKGDPTSRATGQPEAGAGGADDPAFASSNGASASDSHHERSAEGAAGTGTDTLADGEVGGSMHGKAAAGTTEQDGGDDAGENATVSGDLEQDESGVAASGASSGLAQSSSPVKGQRNGKGSNAKTSSDGKGSTASKKSPATSLRRSGAKSASHSTSKVKEKQEDETESADELATRSQAPDDEDSTHEQQNASDVEQEEQEDQEEEEEEEDDGLWGGWGGESSSSQVEKKSQPAPKIIDTMGDDSDSEFEDATPPVQAKKPVLGKPSIGVPSANVPKPAAPMASVAKPVITLATAKPVILTKKEEVAPVNDDDLFGELNMAPVFKAPVVVSAEPAGWPKKDVGSSKLLSAAEVCWRLYLI
eukprot:TRINITY_DN2129_c0_g1_i2.p1 TRINITY_DN2129_c0_g1~~TRINITY_DN2129_c0_g1_i2.p1  ORF type:complete len:5186 (-),score=657.71 TRINITY_DN2129_c0_g1_i2:603-16160(-)